MHTYIRSALYSIAITLVISTLIAVLIGNLLTLPFSHALIYSLSIGLSICLISLALNHTFSRAPLKPLRLLAAIPLGTLAGMAISSAALGIEVSSLLYENRQILINVAVGGSIFGGLVSYFFYAYYRLAESQQALQRQKITQQQQEKASTELQLRFLQAQIEPHFLFNTLATISSLLERDSATARNLLDTFTRYLRAGLKQMRAERCSLSEELALIEHYLGIQAIRMQQRLRYSIQCPAQFSQVELPPLLIQPLVENAIKHGLEMKPAGGTVTINVSEKHRQLCIEVSDNGLGIGSHSSDGGVGLANIRDRLATRYQNNASLELQSIATGGICARVLLPLQPQPEPAL